MRKKMPEFPGKLIRVGKFKQYELTDEQIQWLRDVYPVYENKRILKASGLKFSTMHRIRKKLGLVKSEEGLKGIKKRQAAHIKRLCTKNGYYASLRKKVSDACREGFQRYVKSENYVHPLKILKEKEPRKYRKWCRNISKVRKATISEEQKRVRLGLPRKTKLTMVPEQCYTKRQVSHRYNALKKGYSVGHPVSNERYMIFYDGQTERSDRFENNLKKDGFSVKPSDYKVMSKHDYYIC